MVAVAAAGVVPTTPAGELTAKKTPGWSEQAAINAMIATKLSSSMEPYPTCQAFHSRVIILGVVPEEMRAWKPEIDPQAMVMKQNGKILPAKMGPGPSTNFVNAGSWSCGWTPMIPRPSSSTTPSFTKVLRESRGASSIQTGSALERNP